VRPKERRKDWQRQDPTRLAPPLSPSQPVIDAQHVDRSHFCSFRAHARSTTLQASNERVRVMRPMLWAWLESTSTAQPRRVIQVRM
jgi:hypothetical protein